VNKGNGRESPQEEAVARTGPEPARGRRPYQKPAFRFERVFETMALSCGKVNTTQLQCRGGGRKNS
jgi:hypothetical protein